MTKIIDGRVIYSEKETYRVLIRGGRIVKDYHSGENKLYGPDDKKMGLISDPNLYVLDFLVDWSKYHKKTIRNDYTETTTLEER